MGILEGGMFEDLKEEHRKDSGLTREDIERLTVDENLSDLQRTQLFLSANAHQLQQSCAFERLPTIFHDYGTTAYDTLFPALALSIEHFNPHIQVSAGKAFALIMQDSDLPKDMAMWLLPMTLRMVNLNQILEVLHAWIEVLCVLVPKLPLKVVKEDLLQLALARGKVEETVSSRVVCSRLLGAIAPMLDQQEIEHSFLSKAMALCQDTDAEVRICMCNQLNAISHAVGSEIMKKTVLPELYELLKDEEVAVHSAALTSLVEMLDSLPSDVKRLKILPVLHLLCSQNDAKVLLPLARLFGDLILKMAPDLSEEDIQLFIDSYKSLSRHSSEEVRQLCAHNFPAVLKSIGGRKYAMTLHLTYQQLVQDPSVRVRSNVSAGFHEVSTILGKERTATYLKEAFLSLLNDNSTEVQRALISNLQQIIGQFSVANEQQRMSIYTSMLPHLLQAEKDIVSLNMWRLQTALLETFAVLVEFLTSDQIFEHLVPLCFHYMTESVLPVRSAAAITLAIFVRNNHRAMQRYDLAQTVVREFGHGRSYWARLVYVDFCEKFLSISSTRLFKEHFLEAAILILQDEVIGVRIRACALLPLLKSVVKLPEDATFLERINFCATQRLNDNDKQVAAAARAVADAFKHLSVRCMGVEPGNENYAMQVEFETIDKQREEEEWNMLGKEEQEEQRKLDEMIQKMKTDKRYASTVGNPVVAGAPEAEGGARKTIKGAEKSVTFPPVKSPAIAKLKSTVHQITSLHLGTSGAQSVITASQAKPAGLLPGGSTITMTSLSRSPPILRSQATITPGLAKSVNLQQQQEQQQSIVTPLAPSLVSRSTTIAAPSQLKSASASLESNEPPTVGSGSNAPPSKAISKPSFRAARRSS